MTCWAGNICWLHSISNLCAVGYLIVLFLLAEREVGLAAARLAQVYALMYPWGFILLAGYSESLFLLLAALAFWMALRGCGWAAGLFGALAALARLQGGLLVLPLLFLAWRRYRDSSRYKTTIGDVSDADFGLWRALLRRFVPEARDRGQSRGGQPRVLPIPVWPFLPALASAGFLVGRTVAGIEPIAVTYATWWHHRSTFPWVGVAVNVRNMLSGTAHPTDYLDLLAACLAVMLVMGAWRRLQPAYALYMTGALLFNISHLRAPHPMCSVGRHTVELFPMFFLLGCWTEHSAWRNRLVVYPLVLLWLWLSGQFVLWGWVG